MKHLTLEQRYHISALDKTQHSRGEIAEQVGCCRSTVSRELHRNCDQRDGSYWPDLAQRKTDARHKAKPKRKRLTACIEAHVRQKIEADYSPEQIVGDASRKGIECVSHERIYQFVWDDKKQGGKLFRHMRTKGKRYAKRGSVKGKRGQIVGRVGIDQRPQIVEQKHLTVFLHGSTFTLIPCTTSFPQRLRPTVKIKRAEKNNSLMIAFITFDDL